MLMVEENDIAAGRRYQMLVSLRLLTIFVNSGLAESVIISRLTFLDKTGSPDR